MVYEVKPSGASKPENRFEFTMPRSKKKYSVPLLQFIPPQLVLDMKNVDESQPETVIEFLGKFFHRVSPKEDIFGLFDDAAQFMDWVRAWRDASTVSLGESQASDGSSKESTGAH